MSEIIGGLAKYIGVWLIAGSIGSAISIAIIFLTSGLIGLTSDMLTSAIVSSLPFPISILVSYSIDPLSFVGELILQTMIFFGILYLTNS